MVPIGIVPIGATTAGVGAATIAAGTLRGIMTGIGVHHGVMAVTMAIMAAITEAITEGVGGIPIIIINPIIVTRTDALQAALHALQIRDMQQAAVLREHDRTHHPVEVLRSSAEARH